MGAVYIGEEEIRQEPERINPSCRRGFQGPDAPVRTRRRSGVVARVRSVALRHRDEGETDGWSQIACTYARAWRPAMWGFHREAPATRIRHWNGGPPGMGGAGCWSLILPHTQHRRP